MFENTNSTGIEQVPSGEQETVVESQTEEVRTEGQDALEENRNGDFDIVPGGQESVVDSQQDGNGEDSHVGEDGGESRKPDGAGQAGVRKQTREENAAMRSMRLRAQQEAEAAEKARTDEIIAACGAVNPITKQPFRSLKEIEEYGRQYRAAIIEEEARQTGKSVETVTEEMNDRDFLRNLRMQQEAQTSAQVQQGADEMDFLRRDVMDFVERHPDVDVAQLEKNPHFLKFCGTRFKKEPLADLYEGYMEFKGGLEQAAVAKSTSRAQRSTGGGTSGGAALSPSQQAALRQWNRENPDMPMTEKEFFSRR